MKKLLPILLILICAAAALGQDGLETKYDKFKNETSVTFWGTGLGVDEAAMFTHSGDKLTSDVDTFFLYFRGNGRCYGFCFHDPGLILLIDGNREDLGTRKTLSDGVVFSISRDMLKKIADAKLVEYQVGRYEGKWETKTLNKFKLLLAAGTAATKP